MTPRAASPGDALRDVARRLRPRRRRRRDPRFPESFLFGVGTSDHQCEAYDAECEDIRDVWERATGRTPRGRATDFWNRWPEDVQLAHTLGCRVFRFSVSWTRVEPEPGRFDDAALEHYLEVARGIERTGMQAIVTLHHFTWPPHLEAAGGMLGDSFPDHFADYAETVARRLGAHVAWWITINEPTFLPLGYLKLWGQRGFLMPPGLAGASAGEQVEAASRLIRNLFLAHARARTRIRAAVPGAKVGANPFVLGMPDVVQRWLDRVATRPLDPTGLRRRERTRGRDVDAAGAIDVAMGAMSWTPERERHVLFSDPYASSVPVLLVPAASTLRSARDLGGLPVAFVRGTNSAGLLRALPVAPRIHESRTLERALERLRRGDVAGIASDDVLLEPLAPAADPVWRRIPLATSRTWYCAAVTPNREPLLELVDAAIHDVLGPGVPGHAHARPAVAPAGAAAPALPAAPQPPERHAHIGAGPAASAEARAPLERALRRLRRQGTIVVGVRRDGPFSRFERGEWRGVEADVARALAQRVFGDPSRIRFVELEPYDRVPRVHSLRTRVINFVGRWRRLFAVLTNTNWWYLGMAGRLPEFLCPRECVGQLDFVGFDYYWGVPEVRWDRLMRLLDSLAARYSRAPVYPGGLLRLLRRYRRMFPGKDLLVVENGCVERADGVSRAVYLREHLWQVQRAVAEGVPVRAYLCWSITTNREWGLPLGADSDFGLYRIDLDGDPKLMRVRTPAADTYAAIIASRDAGAARDAAGGLGRAVRRMRERLRRA